MPTPKTKIVTSARPAPSRPPIEGPSAWIGSDMRGREAEWTYRLSPSEIVEIETAVKAVQAGGREPKLTRLRRRFRRAARGQPHFAGDLSASFRSC